MDDGHDTQSLNARLRREARKVEAAVKEHGESAPETRMARESLGRAQRVQNHYAPWFSPGEWR